MYALPVFEVVVTRIVETAFSGAAAAVALQRDEHLGARAGERHIAGDDGDLVARRCIMTR